MSSPYEALGFMGRTSDVNNFPIIFENIMQNIVTLCNKL